MIPLLALVGCRFHFDELVDANTAWTTPQPIEGANTAADEQDPSMSAMQTELYFTSNSGTQLDLYVMTRPTSNAAWSSPQPLAFDTASNEQSARLTSDDITLYLASDRDGQMYGDIYVVLRGALDQPWGAPVQLTQVNTTELERWMSVCDDLHFVMVRAVLSMNMGEDLYQGVLGGGTPTPIAELNTPGFDSGPFLTADCLTLYFASDRDNGQRDIFVSHRANVDAAWDPPQPFAEFNDPVALDEDPWMSRDGRTFVFASDRGGRQRDIYISTHL